MFLNEWRPVVQAVSGPWTVACGFGLAALWPCTRPLHSPSFPLVLSLSRSIPLSTHSLEGPVRARVQFQSRTAALSPLDREVLRTVDRCERRDRCRAMGPVKARRGVRGDQRGPEGISGHQSGQEGIRGRDKRRGLLPQTRALHGCAAVTGRRVAPEGK